MLHIFFRMSPSIILSFHSKKTAEASLCFCLTPCRLQLLKYQPHLHNAPLFVESIQSTTRYRLPTAWMKRWRPDDTGGTANLFYRNKKAAISHMISNFVSGVTQSAYVQVGFTGAHFLRRGWSCNRTKTTSRTRTQSRRSRFDHSLGGAAFILAFRLSLSASFISLFPIR